MKSPIKDKKAALITEGLGMDFNRLQEVIEIVLKHRKKEDTWLEAMDASFKEMKTEGELIFAAFMIGTMKADYERELKEEVIEADLKDFLAAKLGGKRKKTEGFPEGSSLPVKSVTKGIVVDSPEKRAKVEALIKELSDLAVEGDTEEEVMESISLLKDKENRPVN